MAKVTLPKRVLIANRGEIALRVMRTLKCMGIESVAVYSEADRTSPHVLAADHAVAVGPPTATESYLNVDRILAAIDETKADAVHPGYGFLSENANFARALEKKGVTFIGPSAEAMEVMGQKTRARDAMVAAGVPVVPGSDGALSSVNDAKKFADSVGYPVMLKASAGGGGKGMRIVSRQEDLESAFRAAASEAKSAFGDDAVFLEKAIVAPRHIEIQVLGGPDGKSVSLGERECSLQRRHQKVIEESPSPVVSQKLREKMGEVACRAADAVSYRGAGTVEFLLGDDNAFYFLEMNTRLQVEHPVTELCTGLDLVEWQVRVAAGEPLGFSQADIDSRGHAVEARLYAEDAERGFIPAPGTITHLSLPQGPGIRVDAGVEGGQEVSRYYDPMIAKVCAWGSNREQALSRLACALERTRVSGLTTNRRFLMELLRHPGVVRGDFHTGTIAAMMQEQRPEASSDGKRVALLAVALHKYKSDKAAARSTTRHSRKSDWRRLDWERGA